MCNDTLQMYTPFRVFYINCVYGKQITQNDVLSMYATNGTCVDMMRTFPKWVNCINRT